MRVSGRTCVIVLRASMVDRDPRLVALGVVDPAGSVICSYLAGATRVRVILDRTDDGARLESHDNGRGLTLSSGENAVGLGVLSMRERWLSLGGSLEIGAALMAA